jgi:hypothetical protein
MFKDIIEAKTNVRIVARERGKRVPHLCRENHNVWVNLGRQYLCEVISPSDGTFSAHYSDSPVRVMRYMALGIGGDSQRFDIASVFPLLDTHYPGQNTFDDTVITTSLLERPVKVSGTAGVGASPGIWMNDIAPVGPEDFGSDIEGGPITNIQYTTLFEYTDINIMPAYPSVPLTEIGLMLSDQVAVRTSEEVYDYGAPAHPHHINYSTRQKLIAYNTFEPIMKTVSVALEIYWQIQF